MSEQNNRPPPWGRGAALMKVLKKVETAVGSSTEPQPPQEPPKPRGRAALLQKHVQSKQSRAGSEASTSSSSSPSQTMVSAVSEATQAMSTMSVSDPCFYRGESGKPASVACNYIRFKADGEKGFYEYHVSFSPEIDAKNIRGRLVGEHVGKIKMFDGVHACICQ